MTDTSQELEQQTAVSDAEQTEEVQLDDAIASAMQEFDDDAEPRPASSDDEKEEVEHRPEESVQTEASSDDQAEGEVPQHWSKENQERFLKLQDPTAKELVLQMHKEMEAGHTRRSQELAEQRRTAEEIDRTFEPFKQVLDMQGTTPVQKIKSYVAWDKALHENPVGTLAKLAASHGINLAQLAGQAANQNQQATQAAAEDEYADPEIRALKQQLSQVQQQLHGQHYSQLAQTQEELGKQVNAFQSATDEGGNAKYPHFDQLRGKMAGLIETGQAADLEQAYTMAYRMDNSLYEQEVQSKVQRAIAEKEAQRQQEVDKAKKAKTHLSGRAPAKEMRKTPNTIDEAMELAWNEHVGFET